MTDAIRCVLYLRISLDATGERLAISRQREECLKIASARGWDVVREYVDAVSAYSKLKNRPAYNRMVEAYDAGAYDALICWDLDRLTRQPRQLEDWIDRTEDKGLLLVTANGEADLSHDNGRLFARIKASVARAESERKASRQRAAMRQRAEQGLPPLGVRLTGYTTSGAVVEDEAAIVRKMFELFYEGESLRGIVEWLTLGQVPTRRGRPWNPSAVRTILTNPRYTGRAVRNRHAGRKQPARSDDGQPGQWPALVEDWLFDLVQDRLEDPRRRKQVGTDRRHLGSGLYQCGVCGTPVRSHTGTPEHRYRCPRGCLTRTGAAIDEAIAVVATDHFARPDAAAHFTPETRQARDLAAEIGRLRDRLRQAGEDYDNDLIDGRRYKAKKDKLTAHLDDAEAERSRMTAGPDIAVTLAAAAPGDVRATWDALTLGAKRTVVNALMTVHLFPAPRGRKGFDPFTVRVEWRR